MKADCYVYVYEVDGVVRYVGRGRARRINQHLHFAQRRAAKLIRGEISKPHRFYDRLHAAIEMGAQIEARKIMEGLTVDEARVKEIDEIAAYPREQLWNTIYSHHPRILDGDWSARKSAAQKANWANPEYRARMLEVLGTPEARARSSAQRKAEHRDPEVIKKRQATYSSPEYRNKISAIRKEMWADPEFRRRMSETRKQQWADPERRKRLSEKLRERWANPEYRKKMEAVYSSDDVSSRMSAASLAKWSDPEHREKMLAKWGDENFRQRHSAAVSKGKRRGK